MIVTDISELKQVAEYLLSAAAQEQDLNLRSAFINVGCILEQAIEKHEEDNQYLHLYLEIVKASNLTDQAIDECCTTDCIHVRQGTCPFLMSEKDSCPRIIEYLSAD